MSKKEWDHADSVPPGQSDQSTSTLRRPPIEEESEIRMKHKSHPAANLNDKRPTT